MPHPRPVPLPRPRPPPRRAHLPTHARPLARRWGADDNWYRRVNATTGLPAANPMHDIPTKWQIGILFSPLVASGPRACPRVGATALRAHSTPNAPRPPTTTAPQPKLTTPQLTTPKAARTDYNLLRSKVMYCFGKGAQGTSN